MDNDYSQATPDQASPPIHWGHFAVIMAAIVLLAGVSFMEKPQLFSFKKDSQVADANVPQYYPYVTPPQYQPQPQVLGASTDQGPQIIGDDGTVQPVDMGEVLAASTEGVQLSPENIKVNTVAESTTTVEQYFTQAQAIENGFVGGSDFASALASGNQDEINAYAQKLTALRDSLQKIPVPQGLVKLQQLQIIQYNSAIGLLQNFTQGDQNPDVVNGDLQQFLKSQQDLDAENTADAQKYGSEDPESDLYINPDGTPLAQPAVTDDASGSADSSSVGLDNSDNSNANQ